MTAQETGFLAAILANPADDVPRLVYADWLDEQGQADRGEFIRLQIKLVGHPVHHTAKTGCPLRRREHKLMEGFGWHQTWFSAPGFMPERFALWQHDAEFIASTSIGIRFSRGFVEAVSLSPRAWLDHAEELLAAAPIREVTFTTHFRFDLEWGFVDSDMQIAYLIRTSGHHRDLDINDVPMGAHIPTALLEHAWPKLLFHVPHADEP